MSRHLMHIELERNKATSAGAMSGSVFQALINSMDGVLNYVFQQE
jgi:hypothetical protein